MWIPLILSLKENPQILKSSMYIRKDDLSRRIDRASPNSGSRDPWQNFSPKLSHVSTRNNFNKGEVLIFTSTSLMLLNKCYCIKQRKYISNVSLHQHILHEAYLRAMTLL